MREKSCLRFGRPIRVGPRLSGVLRLVALGHDLPQPVGQTFGEV